MVAATPDPNLRYDRQIRLWGPHGQRRLSSMRVLVLGSSVVATETLKSLVLPGVGHFTVVDDAIVALDDLEVNFFLEESDLDQPRASCVAERLKELNPEVSGSFIIQSPTLLPSDDLLLKFDLIILAAPSASLSAAAALCDCCSRLDVALIFVRSASLVGSVRVYVKELPIVESKPDIENFQLWISEPFTELEEYCLSVQLEELSNAEHAHVPYIVLLVQACKAFSQGNGKLPTLANLDEIKNWLKGKMRLPDEQNFTEAISNARMACMPVSIPSNVLGVLNDAKKYSSQQLGELWLRFADKDEGAALMREKFCFWVTAKAVAKFVDSTEGKLPCSGALPDLTATTERFLALRRIYQNRFNQDVAKVATYVAEIIDAIADENATTAEMMLQRSGLNRREYVEQFCKNALDCRVARTKSITEELNSRLPAATYDKINDDDEASETVAPRAEGSSIVPKTCPLNWYILWLSLEQLSEKRGGGVDVEVLRESSIIPTILERMGLKETFANIHEDYYSALQLLSEGLELHSPSTVVGAVAAQEAIKICTGQFLPLNNTFIWDGFFSKGFSLEL